MPEKLLLNQEMHVPFMLGMVAQARTFIIDKPMITLIGFLITSSAAGGVAVYQFSEAKDAIAAQSVRMEAQAIKYSEKIEKLILAVNTLQSDVGHMRGDMERHLTGHPVKLTP